MKRLNKPDQTDQSFSSSSKTLDFRHMKLKAAIIVALTSLFDRAVLPLCCGRTPCGLHCFSIDNSLRTSPIESGHRNQPAIYLRGTNTSDPGAEKGSPLVPGGCHRRRSYCRQRPDNERLGTGAQRPQPCRNYETRLWRRRDFLIENAPLVHLVQVKREIPSAESRDVHLSLNLRPA